MPTLTQKLKRKPDGRAALVNAPGGYRDEGWDALRGGVLRRVTLVSVNDTWSAFGLRPYRPGEARQKAW